jgi:hypothetical protein
MMHRRLSIPILLALSAAIYVGTAGWPALLDSSDLAHAVAAREMAETGDWAVLHINGVPYLEKPPLHYWLVAANKLFGVGTFSTRLPLVLAVVFCANWAFRVFEPHLSSRPLVDELSKYMHPEDKLALYGEYDAGSSIGFDTGRRLWIVNGQYNGLEFGSYDPRAPKIFLDDRTFPAFWRSPERVFLVVPPDESAIALVRLPAASSYFLAEIGGKKVYVNHPVIPGQPSLAELLARKNQAKPAPSASAGGSLPPAPPKQG